MSERGDVEQDAAIAGSDDAFFYAGVGMSAGGLEALTALLAHATLDRVALIVVQHLAPTHDTMLPALLSKVTSAPVHLAEEGMTVEPHHVYVIPPNADLAVLGGTLQVIPPAQQTVPRFPIDFFFRSLADDQADRAIGVVLSGTGTDGTIGLRAIKAAGGITFVQDPSTAKYDGMPRSALDSGAAGACLTTEGIARELNAFARHPHLARLVGSGPVESKGFAKVLVLIRSAFGTDLSLYKPNTTERRIARRMAAHNLEDIDDYVRMLESNPNELRALYKDTLIGVTRFFRDGTPFDALKADVLPRIIKAKSIHGRLRIWVTACSTGEEAYSIAMCVLECLGERAQDYSIQIFGTDVDEDAIRVARRGSYPKSIEVDVSHERLRRFFIKKDDRYQISPHVRDRVVFSVQNLVRDPPLSKLDLVSCRNLLIYLQPPLQKKVLRTLHYALNPHGFLLLGSSEIVGEGRELFALVDQRNKIYCAEPVVRSQIDLDERAHGEGDGALPQRASRPPMNLATLGDRKVLDLYGPPGVIVSEGLDVLHFRGGTSAYLEPAAGTPTLNILRMVRPQLHNELSRALHEAQASKRPMSADGKIAEGARIRRVRMRVVPMTEPESSAHVLLVLFEELPALELATASESASQPTSPLEQRVLELEHELLVTKEYLQSMIDDAASPNEALRSANEELQSANEELQSTNEELETSKEELQSTNEELTTVNEELRVRMLEQQQINDDLHNVLVGVDNAVIIVDMDLRVRRYTQAAERLFNLVSGDIGRSIALFNAFVGRRLEDLAAEAIERSLPVNEDVLCADQRWRSLRVSPYKTVDHAIRGAVLVLVDIDARKRAQKVGREVTDYATSFLSVIGHPLMIIDAKKRVQWANEEYYKRFQVVAEEVIGAALALDAETASPEFARALHEAVSTGTPFRGIRVRYRSTAQSEASTIAVSGSRLPAGSGETNLILLSFEDAPASSPDGGSR